MLSMLKSAWEAYAAQAAAFDVAMLPGLPFNVSAIDFANTLLVCMALRQVVYYRMHWVRLLIATSIMSIGGTTIAAIFLGSRPRWLVGDGNVVLGVLGAFALMFYCPGDAFISLYRMPRFRVVRDVVRGLSLAHAISSFGIEKVISGVPDAGLHTFLFIGAVAGCGGAVAAELLNVLLLHTHQYRTPRRGPTAGVIVALVGAAIYTLLLRNPLHIHPLAPLIALLKAVGAASAASTVAALPPFAALAAGLPKTDAIAVLCVLATAVQFVPPARIEAAAASVLDSLAAKLGVTNTGSVVVPAGVRGRFSHIPEASSERCLLDGLQVSSSRIDWNPAFASPAEAQRAVAGGATVLGYGTETVGEFGDPVSMDLVLGPAQPGDDDYDDGEEWSEGDDEDEEDDESEEGSDEESDDDEWWLWYHQGAESEDDEEEEEAGEEEEGAGYDSEAMDSEEEADIDAYLDSLLAADDEGRPVVDDYEAGEEKGKKAAAAAASPASAKKAKKAAATPASAKKAKKAAATPASAKKAKGAATPASSSSSKPAAAAALSPPAASGRRRKSTSA